VDLTIAIVYLSSVVLFGVYLNWRSNKNKKPGEQSLEDYYLADRKLSWWSLALADLSSYIDIAGTMINTALVYAIGLNGMYIEIRGGVCLALIFQLAFTGKLARRTEVLTKAELFNRRFGNGSAGKAARVTTAVLAIVSGILMVAYFAEGGGKFVVEFLNFQSWLGLPDKFWAAGLLMFISLSYSLVNGFFSIVIVDVYQSLFMFAAFIYIAVLGAGVELPDVFSVFLPDTNGSFISYNVTKEQWTSVIPSATLDLPSSSTYDIYNLFAVAIGVYVVQASISSLGGPSSSGLQTVLAQRDDRAVAYQTLLATVMLSVRWAFTAGVALLAIRYTIDNPSVVLDPEEVLSVVLENCLSTGGRGFVVAAILAAGMTTFDTSLNNASSYWVVDIYKCIIRPRASKKELIWNARIATIGIMFLGWFLVLAVTSINEIWGFVTMAIGGASSWPAFFAWYWWRFNGYGYCAGICTGLMAASCLFFVGSSWTEYETYAVSSAASIAASLVVTFLTAKPEATVLDDFYSKSRPPGLWGPCADRCFTTTEKAAIFSDNLWDLLSTLFAIPGQLCIYFAAMLLVSHNWMQAGIIIGLLAVLVTILYFTWFRRMRNPAFKASEKPLAQIDLETTPLLSAEHKVCE